MRTQINVGWLCVLGLVTCLIGYCIGCSGEQPSGNVEPARKSTSSPDQKQDTKEDDTMEDGTMKKGMMKKGMMKKKGMQKKDN